MELVQRLNKIASDKGVSGQDSGLALASLVLIDKNNEVVADADAKVFVFPTADPHVLNAAYWSGGTLTQSNG